jgi:hypothetical protein
MVGDSLDEIHESHNETSLNRRSGHAVEAIKRRLEELVYSLPIGSLLPSRNERLADLRALIGSEAIRATKTGRNDGHTKGLHLVTDTATIS